jgi:hypothetical protein
MKAELAARSTDRGGARRASVRSVRIPELVLGVILVAGCSLAAVLLLVDDEPTTPVLTVRAPVSRGTVLAPEHLQVVRVPGAASLNVLTRADLDTAVGSVLAADLSAGTPLTDAALRSEGTLGADEGRAGIRLAPGDAPSGVRPGDRVVVMVDPDGASGDAAFAPLPEVAEVWSVEPIGSGSSDVVASVELPQRLAQEIASAGSVRLVQVGA